ncbi:MAG: hypothetical protein M0Z85_08935 [Gammaproteobacteria bacterium]|nr:hypothetical protein [Gammaproteobacteria bacterium]
MSDLLLNALKGIEKPIRKRLCDSYIDLKRNLAESRHEAAGLSAGKLCEAGIRHLQHRAFGFSTPFGNKIANFADECRRIISAPAGLNVTESEKNVLPRALVFLYTMRNKRGIGHVGGDVDPNSIDSALIGRVADWVVCELIRIHHNLSLEEAQDLVDSLAVRQLPDVWEVAGKKRVLREGLTAKDQLLLLLYSCKNQTVLTEDLVGWVEYSNPAVIRSRILGQLHKDRFVEWDRESEFVTLSPKGAKYVEEKLVTAEQVVAVDVGPRA